MKIVVIAIVDVVQDKYKYVDMHRDKLKVINNQGEAIIIVLLLLIQII
jgi:hypothetical protein